MQRDLRFCKTWKDSVVLTNTYMLSSFNILVNSREPNIQLSHIVKLLPYMFLKKTQFMHTKWIYLISIYKPVQRYWIGPVRVFMLINTHDCSVENLSTNEKSCNRQDFVKNFDFKTVTLFTCFLHRKIKHIAVVEQHANNRAIAIWYHSCKSCFGKQI